MVMENGLKLWPQRWVKSVGFNKYTMTMISRWKCVEPLGRTTLQLWQRLPAMAVCLEPGDINILDLPEAWDAFTNTHFYLDIAALGSASLHY